MKSIKSLTSHSFNNYFIDVIELTKEFTFFGKFPFKLKITNVITNEIVDEFYMTNDLKTKISNYLNVCYSSKLKNIDIDELYSFIKKSYQNEYPLAFV